MEEKQLVDVKLNGADVGMPVSYFIKKETENKKEYHPPLEGAGRAIQILKPKLFASESTADPPIQPLASIQQA